MSSPSHTVGLIGPNGGVGSTLLPLLVKAHEEGKIGLVVFHRPGSLPKATLPNTVSVRALDLQAAAASLVPVVKDVQTLVSAVGVGELAAQAVVIEAFSKSADAVTFIPATYGYIEGPEEHAVNPKMAGMRQMLETGSTKAKELGVGLTNIRAGMFAHYYWGYGIAGVNIKENSVQANSAQLQNKFPLVTLPYLAAGIAEIVLRPPQEIKNKKFALVEYWPTGQGLVDILTQLNGSRPTIRDYTEDDRKAQMDQEPMGALMACYMNGWQKGTLTYEGEIKVSGYESVPLVDIAKQFK